MNGTDIEIPTLLADVNVHVKGGAIIPLQGNLHVRIVTLSILPSLLREWVLSTEEGCKRGVMVQ